MRQVRLIITLFITVFIPQIKGVAFGFSALSTSDGLSQSDVTAIIQDSVGFMWFATNNGLTRYDGNRFRIYKADSRNEQSVSCNTIFTLANDGSSIWIGSREGVDHYDMLFDKFTPYNKGFDENGDTVSMTRVMDIHVHKATVWVAAAQGLFRFDRQKFRFRRYDSDLLNNREIVCLKADQYGRILLGTHRGILIFDPDSETFSQFTDLPEIQNNRITALLIENNMLWIGSQKGCFTMDQTTGSFREIRHNGMRLFRISAIIRDSKKNVWIGSRESGVYRVPGNNKNLEHIAHNPRDPSSLSGNDVLSLCEDMSGMMWIGTSTAGVNFTPLSEKPFSVLKHNPYDDSGLSNNVVSAICRDIDGSFWIATKDGCLNHYDPDSRTVHQDAMTPKVAGTGNHVRISALLPDDTGNLYVGSGNGLYRFDKRSKRFIPLFANVLGGRYVSTLYRAHDGRIWCGSSNGLFILQDDAIIGEYSVRNGLLTNNNIRTVFEDSYGSLWVGTRDGGLNRFDRNTPEYSRTVYSTQNSTILSNDISAIFEDSQRRIWIGTWGGGLNLMEDRSKPLFRTFTEHDGLSDNVIFSIHEDASGKLWLSTYNGLSCFDPQTERFRNYSSQDGLAGNEFSVGAHYCLPDHTLLLGGVKGVTIFNPQSVESEYRPSPRYAITELIVNNQSVHPGQQIAGKIRLEKAVFASRRLVFPSGVRSFSLHLASFDYAAPHAGSCACKLEGFDADWNYTTTRQPLTYSNLPPGNYTLSIRSADGKNDPSPLLTITIRPPLWANPWAYTVYAVLFLGLVITGGFYYKRRVEKRNEALHERMQLESAAEIYNAKMRFYTNISHELRTPLTLIVGLAKTISEQHPTDEITGRQITVIRRNAEMLQRLINELLDLRRIETGNMSLQRETKDIVTFTHTILSYFEQTAFNRNLEIEFSAIPKEIRANLDFEKIEKIIYNLLSNAVKFTHKHIAVSVRTTTGDEDRHFVEIRVRDDGEGIRAEDLDRIFLRFYRNEEDNTDHTGAGIGLNLSLEMARLHGGDIRVESRRGEGATFIVTLPLGFNDDDKHRPNAGTKHTRPSPHILIIDDNPDMRFYIAGLLTKRYELREAANGIDAFRIAADWLPDLILCDIMMPGIDGMELCRRFKASPRTAHIPIILVTAKTSQEAQIKGLECGADAYITKPFAEGHLQAQIASLLSSKEQLRNRVRREVLATPHTTSLESDIDRKLHNIVELIDRNLSNPEYTVEQLSNDLFISRMQLYRLIKQQMGQTPGEFLRNYRLDAAARLLDQRKVNISEVGYMVGFVDARYFRQCFKHKFGLSPREYTLRGQQKEP